MSGFERLRAVIEVDRAYRNAETRESLKLGSDLFSLDELDNKAEWDFSAPTLVSDMDVFGKARVQGLSSSDVVKTFYERYPLMDSLRDYIGAPGTGIVVAGSSAGSLVYGNSDDVDIFMYGYKTSEAAEAALRSMITTMISYLKTRHEQSKKEYDEYILKYAEILEKIRLERDSREKNRLQKSIPDMPKIYKFWEKDIIIKRTKNTVSFKYDEYGSKKYQFILRAYTDISEVIHGFDLGSSAVAFDGKTLLFTSLGKFCYENGLNVVDTTRRSTTYESRLRKYHRYGFDIVFPELSIDKMQTRLWDTVSLAETCDLPYFVFTYKGRKGNKILLGSFYYRDKAIEHDYDDYDLNEYTLFYTNLANVIAGRTESLCYSGNNIKDVFDEPPGFTEARIRYFYDDLEDRIWSKFPVASVEKYIDPEICTCSELVARRKDQDFVRDVIERQVASLLEKTRDLSNGVSFMMENAGTQLTSSFNPIIEDASEFYGDYYQPLLPVSDPLFAVAVADAARDPAEPVLDRDVQDKFESGKGEFVTKVSRPRKTRGSSAKKKKKHLM